jgi:hypothetical protein
MNQTQSLEALQRANPRHRPDFVGWAAELRPVAAPTGSRRRRWPAIGIPAAGIVVVVVVTLVAVGSPVGPLAVPPAEAMQQAINASAQAAEDSGTVEVQITQDGELWAEKTVRWNGSDLSVTGGRKGGLLVVDGVMYGPDPEAVGGWIELGPPESVDPDSGTTPDEFLMMVDEDASGATFQRITAEMTDLATSQTEDGSTVYLGQVPAGALARETGVKEGEILRVLPYGYVAHDDASNPANLIDVAITVGADGTIGEILATWGGESTWSYRLTFSDLGSTDPVERPSSFTPCSRCSLPESG